MKTSILCRKVEADEVLRGLIEKKLSKLDKYFRDNAEAYVTLSKKREKEILELTISSNGTLFRSEVESQSFQHAIDDAVAAIERQIRKNKTRLEKRLRDGAFTKGEPLAEPAEDDELIIRTKSFVFKPMSPEEAVLQMNLLGHEFFVFEDDKTSKVCVVYRRKDGAYGMIVQS